MRDYSPPRVFLRYPLPQKYTIIIIILRYVKKSNNLEIISIFAYMFNKIMKCL